VSHFRRRCAAFVAIAAVALFHLGCGDGVGLPDEGVPTEIKAFSGDDQTGPAGGTLALPVVVRVTDRSGRPVANQNVAFAPASGSGSVTPAAATTDNQGKASTAWTLGPAAGAQSLTARAQGGSAPDGLAVALVAHAVSGAATQIEIATGNEQTGSVSSALPDSLVARVIDAGGNPVAGIEVHWSVSGGGSISPEVVVTGEDGLAAAERVLAARAGDQSAQATAPGLEGSPLTFIHTAVAATPSLLKKISGDGQSAPAGFQLADSLVVQLVDQNGNGVGGRAVTWVVAGNEGSVDPVNSVTTPQGFAVTRWTMPAATGDYTIDAVFSGVDPVGFTGHATSDLPTKIELVSGDHQSASVGGQLPAPLRVKVTDANGNPVENVAVTWTAITGGTVGASSTGTDASGIAEVTRTLGLIPGTYTTTAEVDGLSGSPITFTSTATVGVAAKLAIVTQPSSTGQSGIPLETQPVVQLQDAFGNDVAQSGRGITAGVTGGSVTGGTASTDGTGKATFASLAIVGSAGQSFPVTFSSGSLLPVTSDPVTLGAGDAAKLAFIVTPSVTVQAGVPWIQQPQLQLLDAGGNPLTLDRVNVAANVQVGGDTLGGEKNVLTDNGVATFTDLSVEGDAGPRTIRFRIGGVSNSAITFNLTVVAGPAATIAAASDVSQPGAAGDPVGEPPSVIVKDKFGDPVSGVAVTFAVTAGGGTIAPTTPVTTGADGKATLTSWTRGPGAGANTVTATASGLSGSPVTFSADVLSGVSTSTSLSAGDPSPSVAGESVDFTATVTSGGGTPTGNVVFSVDGSNKPAQALDGSGQATFSVVFANAGAHTVGASYNGGGAFSGSTATPVSQTVNQAATTVTVVSNKTGESPPQGDDIEFTATVVVTAPGAGTPTGTVQFTDDQGADLGGPVNVSPNGEAKLKTGVLLEGSHTITATYSGDDNFSTSLGSTTQDVGPPPGSPPIGMGESYNTNEDTPLTTDPGGGVLANDSDPDGDPITAVLVSPPQHSSSFSLNSDGSFTYQPAANYNGPDAFTYRVSANGETTGVLTASLTVAPVNDPPVASPDDAGASLVGSTVSQAAPGVLGNDSDVDGDGLTAVLDQDVSHGSLTLNPDGSFSYTPEPGYTGPDSFEYHAFDGTAASNSVTVSFLVVLSL
jgi:Big-like domain-containing protein